MNNEKNTSTTSNAKVGNVFTTDEKAQYEVFKNGHLPKETIEKWIKNDLNAIVSFAHGVMNDQHIFQALVSAYYQRYLALHEQKVDEMHEPKYTPNVDQS